MCEERIKNILIHRVGRIVSSRVRDSLLLVFMAFLGIAIYSPSIHGPFIFDDLDNIVQSPAVQMTELSWASIKTAAVDGFLKDRPVANVSFALNYLAGQYQVTGYHLVNIILHVVTGFLLYLFFKVTLQIINKDNGVSTTFAIPAIAALIWFVHPLQSQSVAYVVQRMNSMAAMFYLLAMLLYVYGRLAERKGNKALLLIASGLSGLLALGSKENAATLPVFVFLYEWYFLQDLSRDWLKKRSKYLVAVVVSFLTLGLYFLGSNAVGRIMAGYRFRDFTMFQRLLTELRVIIFYMSQLLLPLPSRLSVEHDVPLSYSLITPINTMLSAFFIILLIVLAIKSARRERLLSFSILWYLGNLLIESSVIPLELVFEHRNYLPSMFFVLILVCLIDRVIRSSRFKIIIAGLVIVLFSMGTYQRSTVWGDEETFLRDSAEKAPGSSRVHTALGNTLSKKGEYAEAIMAYRQSLSVDPADDAAYLGLGNTAFLQGRYEQAIFNYRKALSFASIDPEVFLPSMHGLGLVFEEMGQWQEALSYFEMALRFRPDDREIQTDLAKLRYKIRRKEFNKNLP